MEEEGWLGHEKHSSVEEGDREPPHTGDGVSLYPCQHGREEWEGVEYAETVRKAEIVQA